MVVSCTPLRCWYVRISTTSSRWTTQLYIKVIKVQMLELIISYFRGIKSMIKDAWRNMPSFRNKPIQTLNRKQPQTNWPYIWFWEICLYVYIYIYVYICIFITFTSETFVLGETFQQFHWPSGPQNVWPRWCSSVPRAFAFPWRCAECVEVLMHETQKAENTKYMTWHLVEKLEAAF